MRKNIGKISAGREEARRQSVSKARRPAPSSVWGMVRTLVHGVWGMVHAPTSPRCVGDGVHTGGWSTGDVESGQQQDKDLESQIQTRPRVLNAELNVDFITRRQGAPQGAGAGCFGLNFMTPGSSTGA